MTILITRDSNVDLDDGEYYRTREVLLQRLYDVIEAHPVIVVYRGVWRDVEGVMESLRRRGLNMFKVDFIDPLYEHRLSKGILSLAAIIKARHERLLASPADAAPLKMMPGKRVARRDLLLNPFKALLEYIYAPVLASQDRCASLKNCRLCIEACPYNALEGKPPRVNLDSCVSCSLCIHMCPVEALSMPRTGSTAIERYIKIISAELREPAYLLVTSIYNLQDLYAISGDELEAPMLILTVDSTAEVTPLNAAMLSMAGLKPLLYMRRGVEPRVAKVIEEMASIGLIDVISGPEEIPIVAGRRPKVRAKLQDNARSYIRHLIQERYDSMQLSTPLMGVVVVDDDACTLCGACINACPTGALILEEGNWRMSLAFKHDRCISCMECQAVCPEDAIDVIWATDKSLTGKTVKVAESGTAKCIRCGAPIGSTKLIRQVEEKLRKAGVPEHALKNIWLCSECKVASTLDRLYDQLS